MFCNKFKLLIIHLSFLVQMCLYQQHTSLMASEILLHNFLYWSLGFALGFPILNDNIYLTAVDFVLGPHLAQSQMDTAGYMEYFWARFELLHNVLHPGL